MFESYILASYSKGGLEKNMLRCRKLLYMESIADLLFGVLVSDRWSSTQPRLAGIVVKTGLNAKDEEVVGCDWNH